MPRSAISSTSRLSPGCPAAPSSSCSLITPAPLGRPKLVVRPCIPPARLLLLGRRVTPTLCARRLFPPPLVPAGEDGATGEAAGGELEVLLCAAAVSGEPDAAADADAGPRLE